MTGRTCGPVIRVTDKTVTVHLVILPGDSGSPARDADGGVFGILSHTVPSRDAGGPLGVYLRTVSSAPQDVVFTRADRVVNELRQEAGFQSEE